MKRLAHYLILAAVLVGVPLACCVLAGKKDILDLVFTVAPKTEDWGSRPELLWNCRKPFAWWAFAAVLGVIAACAVPFCHPLREGRTGRNRGLHGEAALPVVGMARRGGPSGGMDPRLDAFPVDAGRLSAPDLPAALDRVDPHRECALL